MTKPLAQENAQLPVVPTSYVVLWLSLLERRGVPRSAVLEGTSLSLDSLEREERISAVPFALLVARGIGLTGDPTLGYAFGLAMKPTAHGFLGYALVTCATLRDAIRLGERFIRLRVREARLRLEVEGEQAVLALEDQFQHGPVRQFALEVITAAILRAGELLLGEKPEGEIRVDYPEPPYYQSLRGELPPVRFGMPRTELRFARAYLDRTLALSDPAASRDAVARLERELTLLGEEEDNVVLRVRASLEDPERPFGDLRSVAKRLGMSERTLKRKLKAHATSFQRLLEDARSTRAMQLLCDSELPIERIALSLGYNDPANFTRAFRRWTGKSPTAYRLAKRT